MITERGLADGNGLQSLGLLADKASRVVQKFASPSFVQLVMRLALAVPFWRSGILKWSGFGRLSDTAVTLFTDELMLHLPGGPYHFPTPTVTAFLSGSGEILFPILLIIGLGTRFAALGLLFMTLIVGLTVPDGWPVHLTWGAMALGIIAWGPGPISIDHLVRGLLRLPESTA
jgi:putative oxidoreductase